MAYAMTNKMDLFKEHQVWAFMYIKYAVFILDTHPSGPPNPVYVPTLLYNHLHFFLRQHGMADIEDSSPPTIDAVKERALETLLKTVRVTPYGPDPSLYYHHPLPFTTTIPFPPHSRCRSAIWARA